MTRLALLAAIPALALLGACTDPAHLSGGGAGGGGGFGDPGDPTSPAYFEATIGDRIFFEVDQSTLNGVSRSVLDAQAGWLSVNPDYVAVIEGHADEQGTREYNLALGARRANAVYEYLLSRGIAPERLRTVSFGKERPVQICSEESCYSQNRRSVTVIAIGTGA